MKSFVIGDWHKCVWQLKKNGNPRSSIDWRGARKRRIRHANTGRRSLRENGRSFGREFVKIFWRSFAKESFTSLSIERKRERARAGVSIVIAIDSDSAFDRSGLSLSSFLDKAWLVCQGNDLQSLRLFLTISFLLFLSEDNSCLTTMNKKTRSCSRKYQVCCINDMPTINLVWFLLCPTI